MKEISDSTLAYIRPGVTCSAVYDRALNAARDIGMEQYYLRIGGQNGILGILNEELIDLNDERQKAIEGLKYTPAAALGTRVVASYRDLGGRTARLAGALRERFKLAPGERVANFAEVARGYTRLVK